MNAPLLDLDQLESFAAIGYEDYLELLSDVIRDIPGHLEGIRVSIEAGTTAETKSRVHLFRGMLSYFGCVALTDRLAELERHSEIAADQAASIHAEIQQLWDRSFAAIKQWEISVPDFASKS